MNTFYILCDLYWIIFQLSQRHSQNCLNNIWIGHAIFDIVLTAIRWLFSIIFFPHPRLKVEKQIVSPLFVFLHTWYIFCTHNTSCSFQTRSFLYFTRYVYKYQRCEYYQEFYFHNFLTKIWVIELGQFLWNFAYILCPSDSSYSCQARTYLIWYLTLVFVSFFNLRIQITPLVSSNSSCTYSRCVHIFMILNSSIIHQITSCWGFLFSSFLAGAS